MTSFPVISGDWRLSGGSQDRVINLVEVITAFRLVGDPGTPDNIPDPDKMCIYINIDLNFIYVSAILNTTI